MTEIPQFIFENVRQFGGFLFIGACILIGSYWISSRPQELITATRRRKVESKRD